MRDALDIEVDQLLESPADRWANLAVTLNGKPAKVVPSVYPARMFLQNGTTEAEISGDNFAHLVAQGVTDFQSTGGLVDVPMSAHESKLFEDERSYDYVDSEFQVYRTCVVVEQDESVPAFNWDTFAEIAGREFGGRNTESLGLVEFTDLVTDTLVGHTVRYDDNFHSKWKYDADSQRWVGEQYTVRARDGSDLSEDLLKIIHRELLAYHRKTSNGREQRSS